MASPPRPLLTLERSAVDAAAVRNVRAMSISPPARGKLQSCFLLFRHLARCDDFSAAGLVSARPPRMSRQFSVFSPLFQVHAPLFFECGVPIYGNSFSISVWGLRPVSGH